MNLKRVLKLSPGFRSPIRHALIALILLAAAVFGAGTWAERVTLRGLHETAVSRLDIYTATLESALTKYQYLPYILSVNERLRRLLAAPHDKKAIAQANQYLEEINAQAKSSALYVMDTSGLTLAASNWKSAHSFVGQNYGFRRGCRNDARSICWVVGYFQFSAPDFLELGRRISLRKSGCLRKSWTESRIESGSLLQFRIVATLASTTAFARPRFIWMKLAAPATVAGTWSFGWFFSYLHK